MSKIYLHSEPGNEILAHLETFPGCCGVGVLGGLIFRGEIPTFSDAEEKKSFCKKLFESAVEGAKSEQYCILMTSAVARDGMENAGSAYYFSDAYSDVKQREELNLNDIAEAGNMREVDSATSFITGNVVITYSTDITEYYDDCFGEEDW